MQLDKFLAGYTGELFSDRGDETFIVMRLLLNGMASPRLAKVLNYANRYLADDESYVEIGTYTGYSLLAASHENNRRCIGIDVFRSNFSINGSVHDILLANIEKFPGNHSIVNGDFRNVSHNILEKKIGVLFIDAEHTYQDVLDAVSWAIPVMSDNGLIFFDDIKVPGVHQAIEEIRLRSQFREIFRAESFHDAKLDNGRSSDRYLHNGFSIMTFEKEKA